MGRTLKKHIVEVINVASSKTVPPHKNPISASWFYDKVEFTTPLKRPCAPTRGCTEKPQTAYSSGVHQRFINGQQWGSPHREPEWRSFVHTVTPCIYCGVSPPKRLHPCHRVSHQNLVSYFPWGSPRYYLIFLFTFFSSCITSFPSSLVFPWTFLAAWDGSSGKIHWSEGDL